MIRAALTSTLLLAVLIQAVFGVFARHSHGPAAEPGADPAVSAAHGHHHGHGDRHVHRHPHRHGHGGHGHAVPPAGHFHFGGEGDGEHRHERTGDDTSSYVAARAVPLPTFDVAGVGHPALTNAAPPVGGLGEPAAQRERTDARGRSGWPSGRRLSLLGAWLV